MNLPNKLTVLRVILVPFFVFFLLYDFIPHHNLIALIIFAAASYTDHLDGKIARRDNLITNFGKFMDPLADKILVISALICFVASGTVSPWFLILITLREFAVTQIRLIASSGKGKVIAANIWGKMKTVSQIVAVIVINLSLYIKELGAMNLFTINDTFAAVLYYTELVFMIICTALTIISGWIYIKDNLEFIKDC
ncbi:MAG: CDP-diacylglycerol--glycerol-3-phosphate 3-phosphatidyltransferase [Ruminococcaceae bacterium]|nr:CDP-diacylglycerol--glycerol-3-phosphate 3-phosphatidyltransferase [Oscillospiraceae bacterium]